MADRFVAEDVASNLGIVDNSHKVELSDGSTMRVYNIRNGRGERTKMQSLELKDAKRRIMNRIVGQNRKIRGHMIRLIDDFELNLLRLEREGIRDRQGKLRPAHKKKLVSDTNRLVKSKIKDLANQVEQNIESSVKTYLIGLRRASPNKDILDMDKIRRIASKKAKQIMSKKIKGVSAKQRIGRYALKMRAELLNHGEYNQVDRISRLSVIKKNLVDPKNSQRSCVAKGITRISRTEQNRAMHEAVLEVMDSAGIELGYWRLSSSHKWYGGGEICEVLATNTGDGVESILRKTGSNLSSLGLYSADSFPTLAHPNCMCSIEPVFT